MHTLFDYLLNGGLDIGNAASTLTSLINSKLLRTSAGNVFISKSGDMKNGDMFYLLGKDYCVDFPYHGQAVGVTVSTDALSIYPNMQGGFIETSRPDTGATSFNVSGDGNEIVVHSVNSTLTGSQPVAHLGAAADMHYVVVPHGMGIELIPTDLLGHLTDAAHTIGANSTPSLNLMLFALGGVTFQAGKGMLKIEKRILDAEEREDFSGSNKAFVVSKVRGAIADRTSGFLTAAKGITSGVVDHVFPKRNSAVTQRDVSANDGLKIV